MVEKSHYEVGGSRNLSLSIHDHVDRWNDLRLAFDHICRRLADCQIQKVEMNDLEHLEQGPYIPYGYSWVHHRKGSGQVLHQSVNG